MGEAKRRGSFEERRLVAIKRDRHLLVESMGGRDEQTDLPVRAALNLFLDRMSKNEWQLRRQAIINWLNTPPKSTELQDVESVRFRSDEIGWYLFLCEQILEDPQCVEINQLQRILPYFIAIGERLSSTEKIAGLDEKIDELLYKHKSAPDGLIFELLVALAFAAKGWDVKLIATSPNAKTPDMVVRKAGRQFFVECKRQDRRGEYAEAERQEFLRMWDAASHVLHEKGQWVWIRGVFHEEIAKLPTNFLESIFETSLPLKQPEALIHSSPAATIHARLINVAAVKDHLANYHVKLNSPALVALLGADWAPENSSTSISQIVKTSHVEGCECPHLGVYVDDIVWASGFTREFDSEASIDKKARDVTKQLSKAVEQIPADAPSIIFLAAETLEGNEVERRRTKKVMDSIPSFTTDKPVVAVRFHRFQSHARVHMLFEMDETIEKYQIDGIDLDDLPLNVAVPESTEMKRGAHWNLYS